jgi:RHS repeat-associated protein
MNAPTYHQNHPMRKKDSIRQHLSALLSLCLLLHVLSASGQYIPSPAVLSTAATTPGSFYNETSITFSPGFSATGTATGSFNYYISAGCTPLATNPSMNQNFIMTSVPRRAGINPSQAGLMTCDMMQTIQYFDGLGRPVQTVQVKGSPRSRDIVQPMAYDDYSREVQKYLPYTATAALSNGSYKTNAVADQASYYNNPSGSTWDAPGVVAMPAVNGNTPSYAQTVFEASPLNRVLEQGGPGAVWQPAAGHTVKVEYASNNMIPMTGTGAQPANSRMAALYTISAIAADQSRTLSRSGYYGAGQLYVTVSKDENWQSGRAGTMEEYKDKEGHVVLKRTFSGPVAGPWEVLSTYYVYDDLGNLAYVLPPKSDADEGQPGQAALNALCYQYRYDERNRLTQKRIPGKDWEEIIYNKLDQVVFTQDGEQRKRNERSFNKYDGLGRVIISGIESGHTSSRAQVQQIVNDQTARLWEVPDAAGFQGYTTTCAPGNLNTMIALVVNYYGNTTAPGRPSVYTAPANASSRTTGLLTASKVNVLGTTAMLWTVNYYDDEGRNIKTYAQHYRNATASVNNYDEISTVYNFTDQVTSTSRKHYTNGTLGTGGALTLGLTVNTRYEYDHMGRKTKTYQQTGTAGSPEVWLSSLTYNEIGQLWKKGLHSENSGSSYLQETSMQYNERGWLAAINSNTNLFNINLAYNTPGTGGKAQYNGNISQMVYSKTGAGNITMQYSYDQLNRLTGNTSTGNTLNEAIGYDAMGNITSLVRTGSRAANLAYTYYNSNIDNRLQTVTNNGGAFRSYDYDANGNATTAGVSTKALTYNLLNLPATVKNGSTVIATYTYDAAGNKLRNTGSDGNHDYIGGIQYDSDNSGVAFVATEEGRARNAGGTYQYEYNLKDHLGNVRVSFDKNPATGAARIIQEDEYYAFGLRQGVSNFSNNNRYLYNGKELQTDLTDQFDYGARFYDPVIGRWTSVDPLTEKGRRWSPYNYGMGNPIHMIDPDGMWPFPINIRSFAPSNWFGGGFMGDGDKRGYTTSSTATSRLAQSFTVDPRKGTISDLTTSSNASYHPSLGVAKANDDRGSITNLKTTENKDGSNTTSFTSNMSGHNPLVPGSADIDVHTNFSLTENDKAGTLKVNAVQTGDAFPSAETMIGDTGGNQLFIGVSAANGNPYISLPGDFKRPMMEANFTIKMDSNGVFTGVQQGEKKYTITEWNKLNQNKPIVQK